MTRLSPLSVLCLVTLSASVASAQTNNNQPASRYAPQSGSRPIVAAGPQRPANGGGQVQGPQPATGQQMYGPQPGPGQQNIRQVADEQPIRQPMGGQGGIIPELNAPAVIPLGLTPGPTQPGWIPLDPAHEEWINRILRYWEARSDKIKAFACDFQRWDYDPVYGPRNEAKTYSLGQVKYAKPDKGLFRITELSTYAPPANPGDKPLYMKQDPAQGEHWVCDGKRIFQFDAVGKRLIETELPPEMQGRAIADGPLPFMFGARAETIKARYWIRGLPESGNGKYWLEAVPKSRQDAQNFKLVKIVLDEANFLPEMLEIYAPNYSPENPARTAYVFKNHKVTDDKVNPLELLNVMKLFEKEFYQPKLPSGWKKEVVKANPVYAPGLDEALEATRPKSQPRSVTPLPR